MSAIGKIWLATCNGLKKLWTSLARRPETGISRTQPRLSRRDLLRGRLWKLIRPPAAAYPPLVKRYPQAGQEVPSSQALANRDGGPPSVAGIAIAPVAPTNISAMAMTRSIPVFRPPGAVNEAQFLAGCTRCGECISVCPHTAIKLAPERLGPAAGTPIIEADSQACWMCEDFPCIAACEPGVLSPTLPKIMGTARITQHLCLAHHGTTCTVCSERCPVPGAIEVTAGKPRVLEDVCSGCGVCRFVCPAPENAILLMPTLSRG